MTEGTQVAVRANEAVLGTSLMRQLEKRSRELEQLFDRKMMEA